MPFSVESVCHVSSGNVITFNADYVDAANNTVSGNLKIYKIEGIMRLLVDEINSTSVPVAGTGTVSFDCGDTGNGTGTFEYELSLMNDGTQAEDDGPFPGDACGA